MNEKGRKKRGEVGEKKKKKLMAQENPPHYTCFKGIISVRILQGLRVDMSVHTWNMSRLTSI